jgi:tetratricopeptide (TPR) repeat protein
MILSLIMLVFHSGAQEQLSLKQQADKLFERYEYFKSLDIYLEIAGKNNLAVTERIAGCYREMNDYKNAGVWYAKAVKQPKAGKIDHYYYAETLLRDQKFDEAKAQYKLYYTNNEIGLNLKLADCDSAELWMRQPVGCKVKDVEGLNSEYSDWGLSYNGWVSFLHRTGLLMTVQRITARAITGLNYIAQTSTGTRYRNCPYPTRLTTMLGPWL